jgi:AAA+ ATPase superfamily predicted ATPase
MAKFSAKTKIARDLDKMIDVCATDRESAPGTLSQLIRGGSISFMTFHRIRGFLRDQAFKRLFPGQDMFKRLLSQFNLPESQWLLIEDMSQKWSELHDTPMVDHWLRGAVEKLMPFWSSEIVNFEKVDNGLWMYRLRFPDIHLNFFDDDVVLVVISDPQSTSNQLERIKRELTENEMDVGVLIVLVLGNGEPIREIVSHQNSGFIILDEKDCINILLSTNSKRSFCSAVVSRVPVSVFQPYQSSGKVRHRMFYGRQNEISRIKNNISSNFMVYGGRRIGKSSLLSQINLSFSRKLDCKVISLTAQASTSVEVCRNILKNLSIPTHSFHNSTIAFERMMREYLESTQKKNLILIDEIDDLIFESSARDQSIFEIFNNLNNDYLEQCRFIVAGYRELAIQCMNSESRFYNFGEKIRLGNLSPDAARQLIVEPLCEELGFRFEEDTLVDTIIMTTGRHPNYIQVFCKELSENLDKQKRRKIYFEDIKTTGENSEFTSRVLETFYTNFSAIQQLIIILSIIEDKKGFTLLDVYKIFLEYGIQSKLDDLYMEIRQLEMFFILELSEGKYIFSNEAFPVLLERTLGLYELADLIISNLKREYK